MKEGENMNETLYDSIWRQALFYKKHNPDAGPVEIYGHIEKTNITDTEEIREVFECISNAIKHGKGE